MNLRFNYHKITPEVAYLLVKWKGERLSLDGLKTIDPPLANILATWQGMFLFLYGLTGLDDTSAQVLAKCPSAISTSAPIQERLNQYKT